MAKQEVSGVQVQMAASAGVKLLQVDDLPVPLIVAKSGALGILEGMLQALASGEVILAQPQPQAVEVPVAPVKEGPDDSPEGVTPIKGKGNTDKDART